MPKRTMQDYAYAAAYLGIASGAYELGCSEAVKRYPQAPVIF